MVIAIRDDFTDKVIYYEYDVNETFFLGASSFNKTPSFVYIPDSFAVVEPVLEDIENQVDALDVFNRCDSGVWFDSLSYDEEALLTPFSLWYCFYNHSADNAPLSFFNSAKMPSFFHIEATNEKVLMSTNLSFVRYLSTHKYLRSQWFCWFLGFRSRGITALFFRFCVFTIWFKTIGEGAFCAKIDDTHVQVCLGENHDIVFETLDFVYIKDKQKNTRVFGCFSFHRPNLMAFAHKVRTYYVFNVYEYRGLLYLCERVKKKLTKRRVR